MLDRICFLRHNYYPGDPRVQREANVLVASGFEVDIVALRLPGQSWKESVDGVTVYRLPIHHQRESRLRYVFQYLASLLLGTVFVTALHLRRHYAIVQASNMPDFLIYAGLVPKLLGAKLVLDVLDPMPELYMAKFNKTDKHLITRVIAMQEGASMRLADLVITVLDEMKHLLIQRHGECAVSVIMNCPNHLVFPRRGPESAKPALDHDDGQRFVLLSHGVLVERLGYDTIIEAVALLKNAMPDLELRIVGPGEYNVELKKLAVCLGVADRVKLLDSVPLDQVPDLIDTADLGIVANKNDAFASIPLPTKLLEFAWMGRPAVVSRTSTIVNYFDDDMVAYFEPGNARDLADRVLELYRSPERRRALATNAARFFDRYNWQIEGERYRDLIVALLWHDDLDRMKIDRVDREYLTESSHQTGGDGP